MDKPSREELLRQVWFGESLIERAQDQLRSIISTAGLEPEIIAALEQTVDGLEMAGSCLGGAFDGEILNCFSPTLR